MSTVKAIRWAIPTDVQAGVGDAGLLTPGHVSSWREKGYALVQGLLPDDLVTACREEAIQALQTHDAEDFGSGGKLEFPTCLGRCDEIPLHPNLIRAAAQLLGTVVTDLRLIQSDIWPKRGVECSKVGGQSNNDQRMHCDYGNNTLLHPPGWYEPECVAMIVYLSDVDDCGGGTAVSPRRGSDDPAYEYPLVAMPGYGGIPFVNDRTACEQYLAEHHPDYFQLRQGLYERELHVKFRMGTVLLYRHDVWHRGTPVKPGALRVVANLGYKRADAHWVSVWNRGWAKNMYWYSTPIMEKIVANASVEQRALLGIPPPGHRYWTPTTINAAVARYGVFGFDPAPYIATLPPGSASSSKAPRPQQATVDVSAPRA